MWRCSIGDVAGGLDDSEVNCVEAGDRRERFRGGTAIFLVHGEIESA